MCNNENVFTAKTSRFQIRQEIHQHLPQNNMSLPLSLITPSQTTNNSGLALPPTSHVSTETSLVQPSSALNSICSESATTTLTTGLLSLDQYRFHLYNYAMSERIRCAQYSQHLPSISGSYPASAAAAAAAAAIVPYGPRLALSMSLFHNRIFQPEEPKPQHSYIGLIAIAILSAPDCKLVLSDIYQYILDNYPYFRTRGPGWRNSIRHNLSLNDCFIKAGRSANGKGHYWAIHPANLEDFKKGDFRRRKAQRKVRRHMGLAVDDDGTDSSSPPSLSPPALPNALQSLPWGIAGTIDNHVILPHTIPTPCISSVNKGTIKGIMENAIATTSQSCYQSNITETKVYTSLHIPYQTTTPRNTRKRQFDVASLLAPDNNDILSNSDTPIFLTKKKTFNSSVVSKSSYVLKEIKAREQQLKEDHFQPTHVNVVETSTRENNISKWCFNSSIFGDNNSNISKSEGCDEADDSSLVDEDGDDQSDNMENNIAESSNKDAMYNSNATNNNVNSTNIHNDHENNYKKNKKNNNKQRNSVDNNDNTDTTVNIPADNNNNNNNGNNTSNKNNENIEDNDDIDIDNDSNNNSNDNNSTSSNINCSSNGSHNSRQHMDGVQNILKIYDIRGVNFVNNIDVFGEISNNCALKDMGLMNNEEVKTGSANKNKDLTIFNSDVVNEKKFGIDILCSK